MVLHYCRAPHGARGLKCRAFSSIAHLRASRPTRGAWIEIQLLDMRDKGVTSRPTRGAWIEITPFGSIIESERSRPTRGAWIEISIRVYSQRREKSRPTRGAWIEIGAAAPGQLAHTTQKPQTPRTANAVRGVRYQRKACSAKRTNRKRAAAVAQRRKRYHERSKQNLWDRALPNEGVCSA